jgi:glycosyltransferase involved in cell wall biosynthesis
VKVAIVCDWLLGTGGAERVVLELHHMFPEAPIYTSQYDPNPKKWFGGKWFEDADIRTTWLQKLPKSLKKFLPVLRAWTFSRLSLNDYDLVISSSGAEAKFIKVRDNATHITYCHAPTHYYWSRYEEYFKQPGFGRLDPLARLGLRLLIGPMRRWDYKAAQRPGYLIANSNYTKEQIKKYYGRDATVIHPPVDIERFQQAESYKLEAISSRHGFVVAGRQVPYKKIDLAVKAATKLNLPLIVIGRGPDHSKLKRMAGRSVTFLTNVSDEEMPEKLAQAEAFIFPGIDDFGIVAVEAMAAGTPVIAYKAGGALDFVNPSSGLFFNEQTSKSLAKTLQEFSKLSFNHSRIAKQAEKFSSANFRHNMSNYIKQSVTKK